MEQIYDKIVKFSCSPDKRNIVRAVKLLIFISVAICSWTEPHNGCKEAREIEGVVDAEFHAHLVEL
jgi:hypothetical protein